MDGFVKEDGVKNRAHTRRAASSGELAKLQTTLLEPVLRIAAVVGLPLVAFSIYHVLQIGVIWPVVLVVLGYAALLTGAFLDLDVSWRRWSLPLAMFLVGAVELILYGRAGDAPLYFLGSVVFASLFMDARSSYGVLGGCVGLLVVFLLLRATGRLVPLSVGAGGFSLSAWVEGLVVFGGVGGGLVVLLNTLLPRLANALSQRHVTSTMLREDKSALRGRAAHLRQANEELQRRTAYVERGLSIAASLSDVLEMRTLLDRAVTLIADRFELDDVRIFTVDTSGEWAYMRAASSETGRQFVREGYRVRRGDESAVAWILDHRTPRVFRLDEQSGILEAGSLSVFVLPLKVGEQMVGILEMQSNEPDQFSDEERAVLEGVGQQLALNMTNVRQLGDEAHALDIAHPFYESAQQLAKVRTDQDVYAVILETLQDFDADRVLLVRLDASGEHLVVAADLQGDQLTFSSQDLELLGMQSVVDVVILGLALETSLWVEDIEAADETFSPELTEALFALADEMGMARNQPLRAMAFVPLRVETDMLGGILAFHDRPHTFSPLEKRLFEFMGELGGAALERSALVRDAEVRLEQEQTLTRVGRRLHASFDPHTVVRTVIEEVGRALDVELANIEYVSEPDISAELDDAGPDAASQDHTKGPGADLWIPLGDEADPVAWLNVQNREVGSSEDREMELVRAIAVEAGRALESARLFAETQATMQEADVLYRGSRALIEAGRTDELLGVFVDSLVSPTLDRCMLMLVERGRTGPGGAIRPTMLRVEAVWDAGADEIRYRPGERWSLRDLPALQVSTDRLNSRDEVIVVSDLNEGAPLDPRSRQTLKQLGARAFLASPIISGQRLLGWFVVQALDAPYAFTEHEMRLYRGLSDQAATVLRNFELLEMATARAEQERLLADISARMRETLDMDLILQTALREIGTNLDVKDIEVRMQSEESL
jgi:GAF domain-containing protein